MDSKENHNSTNHFQAYKDDKSETSCFNNFLFNLFNEINFIGSKHQIIYNLIDIIVLIQTFVASFWLTSSHIWPRKSDIIDGFESIIDFRIHEYKNANAYYITGIILFFIFLIWSIYIYFQYQNSRCFQKNHLYITWALLYLLFPIICPIFGSFFSRSFLDLVNNTSALSIVLFIIYIIIYCIMFFVTLFSMDFKSYSCFIPNCIFIGWLPFVHKFLFMILNLCTLGPIFSRLPSWSQFLYTFCIGLLYLFSFLNLQMNPFFHSYMNFIMSIFHIYFTIQEIMFSFRILLTTFFPILYTTIIPLCSLVLVIPIYGYLFHKRNKNIISFLTSSENPLEEHEKPLFYDEHHFQNIFHVLPYLQLGVEHNLDYFIDFSLLHYLAARIRNRTVLVVVARIVAFFPPESNFLNLIIEAIGKFDNIRIIERFFIFHIKKIISMRQILDIDEINHNLYNLRKSSKEMIESIRGLWLEIIHSQGSISYTTFRYIYETSHQMKNQFVDTINKCSDSYEAINEYGTFLIEGLSDFTGSIDCEMKKRMIEKGQKIGVDYSFRSFVNIFPQYLTKEIIDRNGNFIYDEYMRQNLVTLATASSLITMKDSEYIEKSSSLIDDTISQGRLRISIQNSLKSTTFKSLKNYENLNITQLVAFVIIFIFFVIFLPPENDDSIKLIDSFDLLSYSSIDLLLNAYYQSVRVAMEEDKISDEWHNQTLPMNNDDLSKVQSFSNNTNAIISIVEDTLNYYKLFVDSFTRNPKISKYCNFLLEPNFSLKVFEENKINKVIENLTFSQMLRYISSLSQRTASRSSSPLYPSSDLEITDNRLTVSLNSIYLGQVLEKLRQILIIAYDDIGGTQKTTNLAFGIIMSVIVTIIFLPLQIILICNLYSSVKETIKALQKVSPEIVEKSL